MTENEVTIDGVRYVAVEQKGCSGCIGEIGPSYICWKLPDCAADCRKDHRSVIFVEDDKSTIDELTALRELNRELVEGLECLLDEYVAHLSETAYSENARALIAKARGEK